MQDEKPIEVVTFAEIMNEKNPKQKLDDALSGYVDDKIYDLLDWLIDNTYIDLLADNNDVQIERILEHYAEDSKK